MRHRSGTIAGLYGALHAVEAEHVARLEQWGFVGRRQRFRLDDFEAGLPVVVRVWELPGDALAGFRADHRHDDVQVDRDGSLTLMRPVVFVGRHPATNDPTALPQRYQVGEEPAPGGDTSERLIGLAELGQFVDDIEDWSEPRSW